MPIPPIAKIPRKPKETEPSDSTLLIALRELIAFGDQWRRAWLLAKAMAHASFDEDDACRIATENEGWIEGMASTSSGSSTEDRAGPS